MAGAGSVNNFSIQQAGPPLGEYRLNEQTGRLVRTDPKTGLERVYNLKVGKDAVKDPDQLRKMAEILNNNFSDVNVKTGQKLEFKLHPDKVEWVHSGIASIVKSKGEILQSHQDFNTISSFMQDLPNRVNTVAAKVLSQPQTPHPQVSAGVPSQGQPASPPQPSSQHAPPQPSLPPQSPPPPSLPAHSRGLPPVGDMPASQEDAPTISVSTDEKPKAVEATREEKIAKAFNEIKKNEEEFRGLFSKVGGELVTALEQLRSPQTSAIFSKEIKVIQRLQIACGNMDKAVKEHISDKNSHNPEGFVKLLGTAEFKEYKSALKDYYIIKEGFDKKLTQLETSKIWTPKFRATYQREYIARAFQNPVKMQLLFKNMIKETEKLQGFDIETLPDKMLENYKSGLHAAEDLGREMNQAVTQRKSEGETKIIQTGIGQLETVLKGFDPSTERITLREDPITKQIVLEKVPKASFGAKASENISSKAVKHIIGIVENAHRAKQTIGVDLLKGFLDMEGFIEGAENKEDITSPVMGLLVGEYQVMIRQSIASLTQGAPTEMSLANALAVFDVIKNAHDANLSATYDILRPLFKNETFLALMASSEELKTAATRIAEREIELGTVDPRLDTAL